MTVLEKQNPLGLCDRNGNLLRLGARVTVQYAQYGKLDVHTMYNTGHVFKIDPKRPHVVIYTQNLVYHLNGLGRYSHEDCKLDYYHFSKTTAGIWIANTMITSHGMTVPLYMEQAP